MGIPDKRDRRKKNLLIIGAIFVLILFLTILQTYLQGSGITLPMGSNILIFALVNINIILIMVLVLLVMRNLTKLYFERKRQMLGAKFRTRLVVAFVALSIVPSLILFLVSLKLITSSIQRWFDIQLEEALRSSSEIANLYYQDTEESVRHTARILAEEIAGRHLFESYNRDRLDQFLRLGHVRFQGLTNGEQLGFNGGIGRFIAHSPMAKPLPLASPHPQKGLQAASLPDRGQDALT